MGNRERGRTADIPPGWDYNPGRYSQRLPIVLLALVGAVIAAYLALYQYRLIEGVWDPFFGRSSERILDSPLSWVFDPVSDAVLGAGVYVADAVAGLIGGSDRWRTRPWIVLLFGTLVGPLGIVSVGLVIAQPVLFGEWCTLCIVTAIISVVMIGPAMDEVLATLQHLRRERAGGRTTLWRAIWGLGPPPERTHGRGALAGGTL